MKCSPQKPRRQIEIKPCLSWNARNFGDEPADPLAISLAANPALRLIESCLSKLHDLICEELERIFTGALSRKFRAILKPRRKFYPFKAAAKRARRQGRPRLPESAQETMNRIEPSGSGKPGFDVPSSPMPIQNQALRRLNAKIPMR